MQRCHTLIVNGNTNDEDQMGAMIEGKWHSEVDNMHVEDRFERASSSIRNWVGTDAFPAEAGRYLLYIMEGCPWAHRTYIAWAMFGLQDVVELARVAHAPTAADGWVFGAAPFADPLGRTALHEVYADGAESYSGRCTVPVLWDKQTNTIVNNESADILRMLSQAFADLAEHPVDLRPVALEAELDALNDRIYNGLNNGVYRAGFAQNQLVHDEAVDDVFATLDWLDDLLSDGREFLCGGRLTEADIRVLTTLLRFEAYRTAFYCDLEPESEHPYVWAFRERARRCWRGVAETTAPAGGYTRGYASIPFAAINNPALVKRSWVASESAA